MDTFNMVDNVDTLFRSLENFTQKEGIIGKPVIQGDKTFLPVVSITVGYAGGNAAPSNKNMSTANTSADQKGMGALGLGAKLSTDAIILIDNQNVSMLSASAPSSNLVEKIPQIISSLNQNKQSSGSGNTSNS